jgi:hypothetical protein
MGEHAFNILIGKHHGKMSLGRPRHRWENNIKIDFREVIWTELDQDTNFTGGVLW